MPWHTIYGNIACYDILHFVPNIMLWHCMLLRHNTWHSACCVMACAIICCDMLLWHSKCLVLQHTMIWCIVCYWAITSDKCLLWHIMSLWHNYCLLLRYTISCDVTYVCRPFEHIMFQSFIIMSFFFSYLEFSLNVLFWVIVVLYKYLIYTPWNRTQKVCNL